MKRLSRERALCVSLILYPALFCLRGAVISAISPITDGVECAAALLLTGVAYLLPIGLYMRLTGAEPSRENGLLLTRAECRGASEAEENNGTLRSCILAVLGAVVFIAAVNLVGMATDITYSVFGFSVPDSALPQGAELAFKLVSVILIAPICEELLFRAVVMHALEKYSLRFSVAVSGVLFALIHFSFYQLPYALCAGLLLAYFYRKSGSFLYVVALHLINNLLTVLLIWLP